MTGEPRPLLIVEDEAKIAALLADYLRASGFAPQVVSDGRLALQAFATLAPAAVLLDLNLPGLDGIEVCRALRRHSAVPILMITARADEIDRVLGLEIGADDYLCKPFSPREVVARVRALLRRADGLLQPAAQTPVGGITLDEPGLRACWRGQPLPLTPVEYRLLRVMVLQPGRVLSRAQLLDASHPDFRDVSDRAVDSHVKNLRRKLDAAMAASGDAGPGAISAVYGAGYRFDPPADGEPR